MESLQGRNTVFDRELVYILFYLSVLRRYPMKYGEEMIMKRKLMSDKNDKERAKLNEYLSSLTSIKSDRGLILHETLCDIALGQCDLLILGRNKKVNYNSIQIVVEDIHPEVIGVGYVKGIVKRVPIKDFKSSGAVGDAKSASSSSSSSETVTKENMLKLTNQFIQYDFFDYQGIQRQHSMLFSNHVKYIGYAKAIDDNEPDHYIICFLILEAMKSRDDAYNDLTLRSGQTFALNDEDIDVVATELFGALPAAHNPVTKKEQPKTTVDTSSQMLVSSMTSSFAAAAFSWTAAASSSALSAASSVLSSSTTKQPATSNATTTASTASTSTTAKPAATANSQAPAKAPMQPVVATASTATTATNIASKAVTNSNTSQSSNAKEENKNVKPPIVNAATKKEEPSQIVSKPAIAPANKPITTSQPSISTVATAKPVATSTTPTSTTTTPATPTVTTTTATTDTATAGSKPERKNAIVETKTTNGNANESSSVSSWFGSYIAPLASTLKSSFSEKSINGSLADSKLKQTSGSSSSLSTSSASVSEASSQSPSMSSHPPSSPLKAATITTTSTTATLPVNGAPNGMTNTKPQQQSSANNVNTPTVVATAATTANSATTTATTIASAKPNGDVPKPAPSWTSMKLNPVPSPLSRGASETKISATNADKSQSALSAIQSKPSLKPLDSKITSTLPSSSVPVISPIAASTTTTSPSVPRKETIDSTSSKPSIFDIKKKFENGNSSPVSPEIGRKTALPSSTTSTLLNSSSAKTVVQEGNGEKAVTTSSFNLEEIRRKFGASSKNNDSTRSLSGSTASTTSMVNSLTRVNSQSMSPPAKANENGTEVEKNDGRPGSNRFGVTLRSTSTKLL